MVELRREPACQLNITVDQFRAVGHMRLQWAYLEAEIDREIEWLNKRATDTQSLGVKFEVRAAGWRRLAKSIYVGDPELIEGVISVSEKAEAIKPERDKLVLLIVLPSKHSYV